MDGIWEPWTPEIGQRVRIRISAECQQDWGPTGRRRGHHQNIDGLTGVVERRLPSDDPYWHHPYQVAPDISGGRCPCCGDPVVAYFLAAIELEPLDAARARGG